MYKVAVFLCILCSLVYYHEPKYLASSIEISKEHRQKLLNSALNELVKTEGFEPTRYKCPAGFITIGHGHVILPVDTFMSITRSQAYSLLKRDFMLKYKSMRKYSYLGEPTVIALSLCAYNVGETRLRRILGPKPNKHKVHKTLQRLIYYRDKRGIVTSDGLIKRRKRELVMLWLGM